jgi:anaerobic selenocysteine-containing dehydrogenase
VNKQIRSETHFRACNICEAICGLEIKVADGKVISIRGDKKDTFSRGHICPKAYALKDFQEDPDRLTRPVKRVGDEWQELDWDEAFDLVVDRLADIRDRHGRNAIAIYMGNPSFHNYGIVTHSNYLFRLLRTRNRYSASSVDQLPVQLVAYLMYGHQFLLPIPDIDHTDYFLMLGANPVASNGSLMTVPDVTKRLAELKQRAGKLVVIDPRRTETAEIADEHHFIRPGTDAALLLGMLNTLFDEGLEDVNALTHILEGLESVKLAIAPFTPERAAPVTGIDAPNIRKLARDLAAAKAGICYGRMGVSTQAFGTLTQWLIQMINIVTGNFDREGGVLFTTPALDLLKTGMGAGHFGAWGSRVSDRPEFSGELPCAVMAEEMQTPGEGQIRSLFTVAGNPVLSTPNGAQLDEALSGLEFMVCVDPYINETTRHADVILPPTAPLEHDHYDTAFNVLAVRNVARYNPPVLPKPNDARHDWEIFTELGNRLAERLSTEIDAPPTPAEILDAGLTVGPYSKAAGHGSELDLEKLRKHAHGLDLGPLKPSAVDRIWHEDGRIRCAPPEILADLDRAEAQLFGAEKSHDSLMLIGRREIRSNNSWIHNFKRLVKGKNRCVLFMHPDDLAGHDLQDGQEVKVKSRVGEVVLPVQATEGIMRGVVSMPHGWGHGRKGVRMSIAQAHAGVSMNDLVDDQALDELSGNAILNGVPVTVH